MKSLMREGLWDSVNSYYNPYQSQVSSYSSYTYCACNKVLRAYPAMTPHRYLKIINTKLSNNCCVKLLKREIHEPGKE